MNKYTNPGAGLLFMKVGTHARESLEDIIARKDQEIRDEGYAMWGYGGSTCHPSSMVQPFAEAFAAKGQTIHLCMEEMESKHYAEPLCAAEYSINGIDWIQIPGAIQVRGSRYALLIEDLQKTNFALPLDQTRIPIGNSTGKLGSRYIQGRVDKACLEMIDKAELSNDAEARNMQINLVAELRKPYAVFLRGQRT